MDNENKIQANKPVSYNIQERLDQYCELLYAQFEIDKKRITDKFVKESKEFKDLLSQYPVFGTAPHERAFLEAYDQIILDYRDEMRQLSDIYNTLGLKTNLPLRLFHGCNTQRHKA